MKPKKGLKLKERFFRIEEPEILNGIKMFRYAGTFFGMWHIEGCFLLVDNVFIDTGNPNFSSTPFLEFLTKLDHKRSWMILNTHMHEDHCGKNRLIQKELNCKIYSPEEVDNFSFVSPIMNLIWGRPKMFEYSLIEREEYETDTGRKIEVIPTPGHSPKHVAYRIMPDNILYTGDAIPVPVKKRYVTLGENYISELESLKKILPYAEKGTTIVSAHHGILKDSVSLIEKRIQGMTEVVASVNTQLEAGIRDIEEIGFRVFGKPDFMYKKFGNALRCREDWTIKSIADKQLDTSITKNKIL